MSRHIVCCVMNIRLQKTNKKGKRRCSCTKNLHKYRSDDILIQVDQNVKSDVSATEDEFWHRIRKRVETGATEKA